MLIVEHSQRWLVLTLDDANTHFYFRYGMDGPLLRDTDKVALACIWQNAAILNGVINDVEPFSIDYGGGGREPEVPFSIDYGMRAGGQPWGEWHIEEPWNVWGVHGVTVEQNIGTGRDRHGTAR